jgi:hypothetical protein
VIFGASYIALWVLVTFMTVLAFGLLAEIRQLRKLGFAETQPPVNEKGPDFSAVDLASNKRIDSTDLPSRNIAYCLFRRNVARA